MLYLTNAFSLNMISNDGVADIRQISVDIVQDYLCFPFVNAIGHADTDVVVRKVIFGDDSGTPGQRMNVSLVNGDMCIVAQYCGPRLPEGATSLPDGATIKFYKVYWVASNY